MSDAEALHRIRPQKAADRRTLARLAAVVLLTIACVAGLVYIQHRSRLYREKNWASATATIKDGRTRLATQNNSQLGTALGYDVEVLAEFPIDGVTREQWITLSQFPKSMDSAKLQIFLLKGKHCVIRWKPSDPTHIIADIH